VPKFSRVMCGAGIAGLLINGLGHYPWGDNAAGLLFSTMAILGVVTVSMMRDMVLSSEEEVEPKSAAGASEQ
jgi:hypothetical protein